MSRAIWGGLRSCCLLLSKTLKYPTLVKWCICLCLFVCVGVCCKIKYPIVRSGMGFICRIRAPDITRWYDSRAKTSTLSRISGYTVSIAAGSLARLSLKVEIIHSHEVIFGPYWSPQLNHNGKLLSPYRNFDLCICICILKLTAINWPHLFPLL